MSIQSAIRRSQAVGGVCLSALGRPAVRSIAVCLIALAAATWYASHLSTIYAIKDWLFWPIALMWLYNLLLFGSFLSVGHLILTRALRLTLPAVETIALTHLSLI